IFLGVRFTVLFYRIIPIDTNPMHFAAATHLIAAHYRYVVLDITGYNTRAASGAGIQVDRHYPLVAGLLVLVPKVIRLVLIRPSSSIVTRFFLVFGKGCLPDYITSFNRMMGLRLG